MEETRKYENFLFYERRIELIENRIPLYLVALAITSFSQIFMSFQLTAFTATYFSTIDLMLFFVSPYFLTSIIIALVMLKYRIRDFNRYLYGNYTSVMRKTDISSKMIRRFLSRVQTYWDMTQLLIYAYFMMSPILMLVMIMIR